MSSESAQNPFGYFGKLPSFGDFVHQVLPQDFATRFHEWLQLSMAAGRDALGEDFLRCYLNCPAWKFIASRGVCGEQPVVGITIPSVDRVGRYFNFTLATVLPLDTNPVAYVIGNTDGFRELEDTALDILENDYGKDEIENLVRQLALKFDAAGEGRSTVDPSADSIRLSLDHPSAFWEQAATLRPGLLARDLGECSFWWYGQQGQDQSRMVVSSGMLSANDYLHMLSQGNPVEQPETEINYIDRIIAGEADTRGIE